MVLLVVWFLGLLKHKKKSLIFKQAAVYTVSDGNGSNLIEAAVIPNENAELT